MARTVGIDGIESAFAQIFEEYGREVDESLKSDLQYAGEFAANEASRLSPKDSGEYGRGWDYGFEDDGLGGLSVIVHNSSKPSLTHLLEKGHMQRDGGWTDAREHIEPTFERASKLLERRLRNG